MSLLTTLQAADTLIKTQAATIVELKARTLTLTPEEQAAVDALQADVVANTPAPAPTV